MLNDITIAFSVCGEGHGHYGRNLDIINELLKRFPNCKIDMYLYGDTLNIFSMDKEICKRVNIYEIVGFRFVYKKTGIFTSMSSTALNFHNLGIFARIIKLNILNLLYKILRKTFFINYKIGYFTKYYTKYFKDFDFAITDLEPLLPRVALLREKPFLTFDNQHAMIYGDVDINHFTFSERLEHFFISTFLRTAYHPKSDLSILTSFCEIPVKKKYEKKVKAVGPLIRRDIINHIKDIRYDDYILVYAHRYLRDILFPILTELKNTKFVVFTTDDFEADNFPYRREWIEYHGIDPKEFVKKLVRCKAVVSTAGNTLLGESLYLRKPFFAISLEGQFEQRLNHYLLEKGQLGEGCKFSQVKKEYLVKFLNNIEKYQKNLGDSEVIDNTEKIVDLMVDKIKRDLAKV